MLRGSQRSVGELWPGEGYAFTHELVRQTAFATLTPTERLDAYARAAVLAGAGSGRDQLARRAHYTLEAATRSDADADLVIDACHAAARIMSRGYDYEQAAALLGRAAALVEHRQPSAALAVLFTERAEAVLACGRLAPARAAFARAAEVAEAAEEPVLLARAALGNRPVTALTRADLADALVARAAPGDLPMTVALLHQAQAEAVDMKMQNRAELDGRPGRSPRVRSLRAMTAPTALGLIGVNSPAPRSRSGSRRPAAWTGRPSRRRGPPHP